MNFSEYLDFKDIMFSATLAFFITILILTIKKIIIPATIILKNEGSLLSIKHKGKNKKETIDKCIGLFPLDIFFYNGEIFKRGMNIKVLTKSKKDNLLIETEGKFMGRNELDTICILTNEKIMICFIDSIKEIKLSNKK